MCECLGYDDGTRHTCEACVGDLEMLRDALARSESARREAEERRDALYRIAYGRVDLIVRRDEYEKTDEIISLVGDPPPRATSILSLVEGLVTQRDAAKEQAFVAEKALASERAARESWERESNVANTERIRLHNEVENLVERIGQFEAAGFPNVATVLDRVESERAAREAAERERDIQIGVGKEMTDLYCGSLARAEAAESSLSRAVEALREIAEHACIWRVGNGPECRRCYSCIARAALAEVDEVGRAAQEKKEGDRE